MKWLAVFTALVGNQWAEITDLDGPHEFETEQACIAHVEKVSPKLNRILRGYTLLDTMLVGKCILGDREEEG